jgi:hypothetical protein
MGVQRQLIHLSNTGSGIYDYLQLLANRMQRVRVCCGDWSRLCGPFVTFKHGMTGIFLDPPYADNNHINRGFIYNVDSFDIHRDVREWALSKANNPLMRIALCGYDDGYQMPDDWSCFIWKGPGGYRSHKKGNTLRERVWFSPHCLEEKQGNLF